VGGESRTLDILAPQKTPKPEDFVYHKLRLIPGNATVNRDVTRYGSPLKDLLMQVARRFRNKPWIPAGTTWSYHRRENLHRNAGHSPSSQAGIESDLTYPIRVGATADENPSPPLFLGHARFEPLRHVLVRGIDQQHRTYFARPVDHICAGVRSTKSMAHEQVVTVEPERSVDMS